VTTTVPTLRKAIRAKAPSLELERRLWVSGCDVVAGMDEVGRGAWAGPLSVCALIVPKDRRIYKIRDSKMLTETEREAMFDRITAWATAWAVGHASPEECDTLGMADAQRLAAQRALAGLGAPIDRVLLDGNWDFVGGGLAETIVKGDAKSLSIAAASIVAKVTRDRIMRGYDVDFPWYHFVGNKGYPGPKHKAALQYWGPSSIHRRSWVFMDHLPWTGIPRYVRPEAQQTLF